MDAAIFYREDDEILYIRAQGHVTAALCPELRELAFPRLEAPPAPREVYLDLSGCEYMDSTFLGLIVGMNKRFLKASGRRAKIVGVGDPCMGLLKTMGICKLLDILDGPVEFPAHMENLAAKHKATAELLLDAHAELMKLSDENDRRFSTLYAILQKSADAEREKGKE